MARGPGVTLSSERDASATPTPRRSPSPSPAIARSNSAVARAAEVGEGGGQVPSWVARTIAAEKGGGERLDAEVAARLATVVGADLAGVRVHVGSSAQELTAAVGARAFTVGSDIWFAAGEYHPQDPEGQRLIAHELTHVLQNAMGRGVPAGVSSPTHPAEREAAAAGRSVTSERGGDMGGAPVVRPSIAVPGSNAPVALARDFLSLTSLLHPVDAAEKAVHEAVMGILSSVAERGDYHLLTMVLGHDPLSDRDIPWSTTEFLHGLVRLLPRGTALDTFLTEQHVVESLADVLTAQLAAHHLTKARVTAVVADMSLDGVEAFLDEIGRFASDVIVKAVPIVLTALKAEADRWLEDKAAWRLLTEVLHRNPLTGEAVAATTTTIVEHFLVLLGKEEELQQMRERGVVAQVAAWLDAQLPQLQHLWTDLQSLFAAAWAAVQPDNLVDLPQRVPALLEKAMGFVAEATSYGVHVVTAVWGFVKEAVKRWVSEKLGSVRGWHLLTAIIGRDPLTGTAVPGTAEAIVLGVVELLPDGTATAAQMKESGVVGKAATAIIAAMSELGISLDFVVGLVSRVWDDISWADLTQPFSALERMKAQFGEPIGRLVAFGRVVVREMIHVLLALMGIPPDMVDKILGHVLEAYEDIKSHPLQALAGLVDVLRVGFEKFVGSFPAHLLGGLKDWLFGALAKGGVQVPADLSVGSIIRLVLDVMGVGLEHIWTKLGEKLGPERAASLRAGVDKAEAAFAWLTAPAGEATTGLVDQLTEHLSDLWGTLVARISGWVTTEVVEKAVLKIVGGLATGGVMVVVNAVQAFFGAVRSAVRYLKEILGIVDDVTTTAAAVARGEIEPGAAKLEHGLASAIPVAIGFLAEAVGLGDIATTIADIITALRAKVDAAIDKVLQRLAPQSNRQESTVTSSGPSVDEDEACEFEVAGVTHQLVDEPGGLMVHSDPHSAAGWASIRTLVQAYGQLRRSGESDAEWRKVRRSAKRTIAAALKTGFKDGPVGHAPHLGDVGPYQTQESSLRDKAFGLPETWAMEAEHVIPRQYVNELFKSLQLPEVEKSEYRQMTTVLIYRGAALGKTYGQFGGGDAGLMRRLATALAKDSERKDSRAVRRLLKKYQIDDAAGGSAESFKQIFDRFALDTVHRTEAAVLAESTEHGASRDKWGSGYPGDGTKAYPTPDRIQESYQLQRDEIISMLEFRL